MLKKEVRQNILSKLKNISEEELIRKSNQISLFILESNFFIESKSIAFYWPFKNEVDIKPLINSAKQQNKKCYLPVIENEKLIFSEYTSSQNMKLNKYGILEPKDSKIISPKMLDLILVPLVAFNKKCYRLGKGAGYYDKTFMGECENTKQKLIGIGFDIQEIDELPVDSWDVKLFGVVTESRFLIAK